MAVLLDYMVSKNPAESYLVDIGDVGIGGGIVPFLTGYYGLYCK